MSKISNQQGHCYIRVYHQTGDITELYHEITSCSANRSLTDINGNFSFSLLPNCQWDEVIMPDDFVRIFMGNKFDGPVGSFSRSIDDISKTHKDDFSKPKNGYARALDNKTLPRGVQVVERFVGTIGRCQPSTSAATETSPSSDGYAVSGRSLGSIISRTTLYFNEHLPGMNAISAFYDNLIDTEQKTPDENVALFLAVTLTMIPFPQWQVPAKLAEDIRFPFKQEQITQARRLTEQTIERLEQNIAATPGNEYAEKVSRVIEAAKRDFNRSPLSVIALAIGRNKKAFGEMFNNTFLNDRNGTVMDLVNQMANRFMNEFWFDLCPGGDPESSPSDSFGPLVPTFVLRQMPYDITPAMLVDTPPMYDLYKEKLDYFVQAETNGTGSSMLDLANLSFSVAGRFHTDRELLDQSTIATDVNIGFSGDDRLNGFLVLPSYSTGTVNGDNDRILMAENGSFLFDEESVLRYGFRMQEVSSLYCTPPDKPLESSDEQNYLEFAKRMTQALGNWYFMNPVFINGRISSEFIPDARLGIPVNYLRTDSSYSNQYAKKEVFYCQGVEDTFVKQGSTAVMTTNLTVTRGIRYKLGADDSLSGKITLLSLGDVGGLFA